MSLVSDLKRIGRTLNNQDGSIVLEAANALALDPYPLAVLLLVEMAKESEVDNLVRAAEAVERITDG